MTQIQFQFVLETESQSFILVKDVIVRGTKKRFFLLLKNIWISIELKRATKFRIFNSISEQFFFYGAETRSATKKTRPKNQSFITNFLRRIFEIPGQLWMRAGEAPVFQKILRRKWRQIGHTMWEPTDNRPSQTGILKGRERQGGRRTDKEVILRGS